MNDRPTFGAVRPDAPQDDKRAEIGAIWNRESSSSNFLSIKLNITKELLKQLSESNEEVVSVNLVAFPNKYKDGNESRPDFRIYQERKRT